MLVSRDLTEVGTVLGWGLPLAHPPTQGPEHHPGVSPSLQSRELVDLLGRIQKRPGGSLLISTSFACWGHRKGCCSQPLPSWPPKRVQNSLWG